MLLPLLNKNSNLSRNSKRLIYLQYLQPVLTYACQIWGCAAPTNVNNLQVLQNRALRILLNYPQYIARKYLHRDAGIQPLNERSLATKFHSQISTHPNMSISVQAQAITTGRFNHPIHSTYLPNIF
ncbi:reverse transcriptase domain-containing protein [Trichonephila inaurata madagascariensis]|uniref:Reverse transcriptase domain-containing protein n=1 Tax=Trichonephila inaurata madagascariensis TaxID=2747483 RepID=A0A8X6WTH4_9ARAC|nr:reverse transcriptase domain-containing protein [Trichonephila inaurata madagascariensis]